MRPVGIPMLLLIGVLAGGVGAAGSEFAVSRGGTLPVAGWLSGLVLLVLAGVLVALGLPLRRYLRESEERRLHPTLAPRRHQLDMPTAYRTVQLARAAAYTGAICAGLFLGEAVFLVSTGLGDLGTAVLPTTFAGVCAIVLAVVGVIVERWGTLPPSDSGDSAGRATPA
ncbi:DUF3180 domain-containing protein [Brachybacterium sp. EF45031]|uniref:DUF3180 domain-containing protein n=1 Tax=Brachybacterium sillae TaxID=2810536 RepID=UPI00217DC8AC|nr:DUF3180 domain-containing protein [Brachybacterium sillae]MCS6712599.1 DUF3180 domain-containing protein [Brachybacterium sillae]